MQAEKGKKVKIEYTGTFEDGTVFDSSEKHGQPLEFEVGAKQVVPGFENAVEGMKEGEEKEVTLQPEEGYGPLRDELKKQVPRDQLPEEAEEGAMLTMQLQTGQQIPAKIEKLGEKEATLDLNHPLAGKVLKFKIKVVGVEDAPESEDLESQMGAEESTESKE